ncbi:hypothetical protein [Sporosarcina sp.]|uniref:hypothetical protein n=1 Tax=Sporosarcina sp. TaxID=49982 RepID=UPI0026019E77|nr:hypothetical protein [Sporosarcina sp.]
MENRTISIAVEQYNLGVLHFEEGNLHLVYDQKANTVQIIVELFELVYIDFLFYQT